jgi:hypothetical protein
MVINGAQGPRPNPRIAIPDAVQADRSARRVAAAKAAAAAGGLLSLSMVLLGQPQGVAPQLPGSQATVRTAPAETGSTASGAHHVPPRSAVSRA